MTTDLITRMRRAAGAFSVIAGAAALALAAAPAGAQTLGVDEGVFNQDEAAAGVPPPEVQTMLVQSTLSALNQANLTNDYSVFLKLSSSGFQQVNSPGDLSSTFAGFRDASIDLAPVVLYPIRWTYAPSIQDGALRLIGVLPSRPQATTFDLAYVVEGNRWRVAAVSVGLEAARP